jgi:GDPmannose 4,6-dehydratase
MADQDHVGWSEDCPGYSIDVTAGAVGRMLEVVKEFDRGVPFLQPISATVFGPRARAGQTVDTPLDPQSPYACAKAHAWHLCRYYRQQHGMFVVCPVLYNHDSPRRGPDYLLQKIARGVQLTGDLSQPVDIGYAPEFVLKMWEMMQRDYSNDYLIGTGKSYRIADLFRYAGTDRPKQVYPTPGDDCWLTPGTKVWNTATDAVGTLKLIMEARQCVRSTDD